MKILIAGDFAPGGRLVNQIENRQFSDIFLEKLVNVVKSADYSIVNFERPVTNGTYKPIFKIGPNLQCTDNAVEALKYVGFSAVTVANNHILDFGKDGLNKTIECCKKNGIDIVGVGNNLEEAKKIMYVEKNGKKLAIINCCEREFSIATDSTPGANPLNPTQQYYSIQEARNNADYVLVIVHGGIEYYQLPTPQMQETYRFFIDAGADAVVNHHQHCYSGYEVYNNKPIFYGLGNFLFDGDTNKIWVEGYMVEIIFGNDLNFKIYPYEQCGENPSVELLEENAFDEKINKLNNIISNSKLLKQTYEKFCFDLDMSYFLEPIRNRWILAAQTRKILPSFISKEWMLLLLNIVRNESHRNRLIHFLQNKVSKDYTM